ncbi:MAG: hypothetical protein KH116_06345 [Clostridium sp.]|nr:hypothetical protein [Clostridium sp.]
MNYKIKHILVRLTLSPTGFPRISNKYLPFVETNMTILNLGDKIITIGNPSIYNRFPKDGFCQSKSINGIYYLIFDIKQTK